MSGVPSLATVAAREADDGMIAKPKVSEGMMPLMTVLARRLKLGREETDRSWAETLKSRRSDLVP